MYNNRIVPKWRENDGGGGGGNFHHLSLIACRTVFKKKKKALEKGIKRQFYGLWDIYAKY